MTPSEERATGSWLCVAADERVQATLVRRCTQCGEIYGQGVVELSRELVDAGLTESHGYCRSCAASLEAALDAELAAIPPEDAR